MGINTNSHIDDRYLKPLKKLEKVKTLLIETNNKNEIQAMINSLMGLSGLSPKEKYNTLTQMIVILQDMEKQQKDKWFKLDGELSFEDRFFRRSELKNKLKKLSKLIVELGNGVEMMYDLKSQESECAVKLF